MAMTIFMEGSANKLLRYPSIFGAAPEVLSNQNSFKTL
jgi:hypothetical protein